MPSGIYKHNKMNKSTKDKINIKSNLDKYRRI